MSGTTGPENDPGIADALDLVIDSLGSDEHRVALYAAIADWHRRQVEALRESVDAAAMNNRDNIMRAFHV